MMPTSELITVLRTGAQGLDPTVRFLILDACERLERKTKDNELLAQKIAEMRSRTVKTNADRIRAMTDEELVQFIRKPFCDRRTHEECTRSYCGVCDCCILDWLKEPAKGDV